MKTRRLKRIKLNGRAHYHVMSRVIERRFYLKRHEKDVFCDMMWRVAAFSGVRILTFCIMDNHFHLLVEVPSRRKLSLEDVKNRLPLIYRNNDLKRVLQEFERAEMCGNNRMIDDLKQQYEQRMYDLSEFMKTLKQRYSIWYNRNHDARKGTLWEGDRFISVLVQSPRRKRGDMGNLAVQTMAAYIELNAVRAGIVQDPKNYQWCGYGAAISGHSCAENGIGLLMGFLEDKQKAWSSVSQAYRKHLYIQGGMRGGISVDSMQDVLNKDGSLSRGELLHCRVRYFSSGLVIGAEDYVTRIAEQNKAGFCHNRPEGVRSMRGGDWGGLCAAKA